MHNGAATLVPIRALVTPASLRKNTARVVVTSSGKLESSAEYKGEVNE
jgi:hypothetical protein